MASYKNFSKKDRQRKDSTYGNSKQDGETTTINKQQIKGLHNNKDIILPMLSYFRYYPDRFIDFISTENSKIRLYFFQRLYLRVIMRYRKVFITATRGTSKSFLTHLAFVLKCIMYPNNKLFVCAPGKEQAAKITQECLDDVFSFFPALREEVKFYIQNKDYTKLIFYNGSRYDVVQMRDSARGGRKHIICDLLPVMAI